MGCYDAYEITGSIDQKKKNLVCMNQLYSIYLILERNIHLHVLMQVFVVTVVWSNNERFEIYRRYNDFFSLHVRTGIRICTFAK